MGTTSPTTSTNKHGKGHPENSADNVVKKSKNNFTELIKNTYRVLLLRGMKGCYIYFTEKDTERFFKSRIENSDLNLRQKNIIQKWSMRI